MESKYARVVYMNSYFSNIITPKGWGNRYSSTLGDYSNVQYYEYYNNTGPGSWDQVREHLPRRPPQTIFHAMRYVRC